MCDSAAVVVVVVAAAGGDATIDCVVVLAFDGSATPLPARRSGVVGVMASCSSTCEAALTVLRL